MYPSYPFSGGTLDSVDTASDTMPILTYIGRTISLNNGSFLANRIDPTIQATPLIINVSGAPI